MFRTCAQLMTVNPGSRVGTAYFSMRDEITWSGDVVRSEAASYSQ